jgi:hypothetical protein
MLVRIHTRILTTRPSELSLCRCHSKNLLKFHLAPDASPEEERLAFQRELQRSQGMHLVSHDSYLLEPQNKEKSPGTVTSTALVACARRKRMSPYMNLRL